MALSQAESKAAFNHVLDTVLGRGDGTNLKSALLLEGFDDIGAILTMSQADIDTLIYEDSSNKNKRVSVNKGDKSLVRIFKDFVTYSHNSGSPIQNWLVLTHADFNHFRITVPYQSPLLPSSQSSAPTASSTTQSGRYTPAEQFRRGIKRDPSLFPTLKEEKFNDSWHRAFNTQARAQDVHDVLNDQYRPSSQEERDLFMEKLKYLYAVLEAKVLTDRGKAIIREHEQDFDAQVVYKKLVDHHLRSTKAQIDSSTILSYITSVRLGNGEWKGSTEGFITHWENQVRLYERQVPSTDHFSDGQKRVMMENAVAPIQELRQVKNTADLEKTRTGRSLTFAEYSSLLLSAASSYDEQYKSKRDKRQVFSHITNDENYSDDDVESYDIDAPVDLIQANAHDQRSRRPPFKPGPRRIHMARDRWMSLSDKDRLIWDQLDDNAKATILGLSGQKPQVPPSRAPAPPTSFRANLHELSAYDFLQAQLHDIQETQEFQDTVEEQDTQPDPESEALLINMARSSNGNLPPGDIRRVMSKTSKRHTSVNMASITYHVSNHKSGLPRSLIDRGANGGIAGTDVRVIHKTHRSVDVRGIDNHQVTDISIGTVGGVVTTQKGPIIAIFHQYALLGKGSSIHSAAQMEWFKCDVNDKSVKVGGLQRIKTLDGYTLPLTVKEGLPRLEIRPYTDQEWDTLPHVFLTGDSNWDPSVLDHNLAEDEQWADALDTLEADPTTNLFDEFGKYRQRVIIQQAEYLHHQPPDDIQDIVDHCVSYTSVQSASTDPIFYDAHDHEQASAAQNSDTEGGDMNDLPAEPRVVTTKTPDFSTLRPLFGWLSVDIIQKTFEHTTQYARLPVGSLLKRSFKSSNPAMNVSRRNEPVACDIVYADEPAIDDGSTTAVIFVGTETQVTDVYGIKTDKQFVNTLEDNIRQRGAPTKLISDRAQVEISNRVLGILRALIIGDWQSEPHQQQQNPAERRYQTVKNTANRVMDRTGAPPYTWLLCLVYVCYLLNHTFNVTVGAVPLTNLTGKTMDISPLLRFHFWQRVYYLKEDSHFPSESKEGFGNIVGISEHCGHALTWKILTEDTMKVIYRSQVRPCSKEDPNFRASIFTDDQDITNPIIKMRSSSTPDDSTKEVLHVPTPIIDHSDLIGRTFLMDEDDTGQKLRARIVKLVEDHESALEDNPARIKFMCSINNDQAEELIAYNKVLEYLAKDETSDVVWKFKRITSHQGPLKPDHHDYKVSMYNVMVEWENGEITTEPLQIIAADDPVTCAIYARDNNLLDLPGWKRFKNLAKHQKKFTRLVNQAKLRSFNTAPRYKYGFEIPKNYDHAMRLDAKNKNTKWKDSVALELMQIDEYNTFTDLGHHTKTSPPAGYKKIRVHLIFDVKHDGRHRARLVADGHLTDIPLESVYSGVVSLKGLRLVVFLAELNQLELWCTDIGSAYLEAITSEKLYIVAGPEFGDREGHILVIHKALYGLRSSGARWHERFADCLRDIGFFPCKAEPDIWMRRSGNVYEYIAVYVDDLAFALKDPQAFATILQDKYSFKIKGTGPISYHLGMDFFRDKDGTLCIAPRKYIEKMIANFKRIFGEAPRHVYTSPIEKGDHPELDTSELLDHSGIAIYHSLIGALQWVVTTGRFDVMTAVMTMSGFREAPRRGHLERVKRIYGYLSKMQDGIIRVRTDEPDYSDVPDFDYDWTDIYGDTEELKPTDAPEPLGHFVTLTHYVDANLMHDIVTGRSVTGILHLINKTPFDWYSKKQATVETATYGSEFVAARICVEQIIELRNILRYLGVPIRQKSYMFGDNQSVVNSSMQVHAKLHKRHTILSFHRVREAVAAGIVHFHFIPGQYNPADILSKHWGYSQVWTRLKTLMFWHGDTADIEETAFTTDKRGVTKYKKD